jgi:hypothetical protein
MSLKLRQVAPSAEVLVQTVDQDAVLLDMRSEQYFSLNSVGRRVWELLQETGDVAAIRDRLSAEYDVPMADLERDLDALLARLLEAGLVSEKKGASA